MSNNTVMFGKGTDTDGGLSPAVWKHLPRDIWTPGIGVTLFDDFNNYAVEGATAAEDRHGYETFGDTGVTFTNTRAIRGGLVIGGNDADNDQSVFRQQGTPYQLIETAPKAFAFECKIKKAAVTDNTPALFIGLQEDVTAGADVTLIDDNGALADDNLIGFHLGTASDTGTTIEGELMNFSYKADGQTVQEKISDIATLTADTFVKLGFAYNPDWPTDRRIKAYVNGTPSGTYVTSTNMKAATFPSDVAMGPMFGTKNGAAAESLVTMEWWAFAQMY